MVGLGIGEEYVLATEPWLLLVGDAEVLEVVFRKRILVAELVGCGESAWFSFDLHRPTYAR